MIADWAPILWWIAALTMIVGTVVVVIGVYLTNRKPKEQIAG